MQNHYDNRVFDEEGKSGEGGESGGRGKQVRNLKEGLTEAALSCEIRDGSCASPPHQVLLEKL